MELRLLEYFLIVVREENISRTAEVLYATQPTLSRQMNELAGLLKCSGMTDDEVKSFLKRCENSSCCAEKVRILRKTRAALLDTIHEKQAVLDRLDDLIWNMEH